MAEQPDLGFNQRDLGHGAAETILHPAVALALLVTIVFLLWRPRIQIIVPMMMTLFLVPRGQEIYVAGQHFYVLRIVILMGLVRLAQEKFRIAGGLNGIDKAFLLWASYRGMAGMLTRPGDTIAAQIATSVQVFGGYFLLRYLIRDEEDIARSARVLAVTTAVLGACMLIEYTRMINVFGYLGGAPWFPEVRNGQIRAQATFGHSILAGCFGATLIPLFFWLWKNGKDKALAIVGMTGSTVMMFTASSSTPVLAWVAGVGALLLWPIRGSMRTVRWGLVLTLVTLALVMKAPVWFIIAHVNVTGSSGGYDRAELIDVCVRHIKDWWLIGSNNYGNWGWDMWDLSDQFVAEAEVGGLASLVFFIAMISRGFGRLGTMRRQVDGKRQWLLWSLGAVMLSHIFAYFGVSYWDQTQMWWFAFLAMISAATIALDNSSPAIEISSAQAGVVPEPAPAEWFWAPGLPTSKE
ncbi:MAG: hypothetical protein ABJC09_07675 [Terriglobia bacterium]